MARIETDPNYSSPTFSRATAATDPFKKEDVQALAAAFSTHDHSSGKGVTIGTIALGGDLNGTIANGRVLLANASAVQGKQFATGTPQDLIRIAPDNTTQIFGVSTKFWNETGATLWGSLDAAGVNSQANFTTVGGNLFFRDTTCGIQTDPSKNLYYRGGLHLLQSLSGAATWATVSDSSRGGFIGFANGYGIGNSPGHTAVETNGNLIIGGGNLYFDTAASMRITFVSNALQTNMRLMLVATGDSGWGLMLPSGASPPNYNRGQANGWDINSMADLKTNVAPLEDPMLIVQNDALHGVTYSYIGLANYPDDTGPMPKATDADFEQRAIVQEPSIGFIADEWLPFVPEIVSVNEQGKAVAMDYARVGAITFEALKHYMAQTDARLAALEAAPAP